jgi:hypothetical protein
MAWPADSNGRVGMSCLFRRLRPSVFLNMMTAP